MHDASDEIALIKARRSHRLESTRSQSEARAQIGAVDGISEHRTIEILLRFGDRGRHVNTSGATDLHRTGERRRDCGIVAHDHRTIATINQSSPNRMARNFRATFSIKQDLLLFVNSTFGRAVKKLSGFEGRS